MNDLAEQVRKIDGPVEYEYDVFLSFTGGDLEIKNRIFAHLEGKGLRCYDSDLYCNGQFRPDFCRALDRSRVYLMILSDNLRRIPDKYGNGTVTEVCAECSMARELESHNQLNIVILCISDFFRFDNPYHKYDDQIGWFFYSNTRGFSQIRGSFDGDGGLSAATLDRLEAGCKRFIDGRNAGRPIVSQLPKIEIATERLLDRGVFRGREREIDEAIAAFSEGKQAVVLTGLGGIGKTALATEIARRCEEKGYLHCPQIVHIRELGGKEDGLHAIVSSVSYEKSVYDSITVRNERDRFERKLSALRQLPDTVLLVIDNYNSLSARDLEEILSRLSCRLLITTRVPLEPKESVAVLPIGRLPEDEAYGMFAELVGGAVDRDRFARLYSAVGGHTITLCIMARMSAVHHLSLEELIAKMGELDEEDARVDFWHNEYGDADTMLGHLRKLFDINKFSEGSLSILRSMSVLSTGHIPLEHLVSVLGLKNRNYILELTGAGWLEVQSKSVGETETEYLYLHPIISRLCTKLLSPSEENVGGMVDYLLAASEGSSKDMTYSDVTLLADSLYYACYVLAGSSHTLCERLWDRFAEVNHLLGDAVGTAERAERLALLLGDRAKQEAVVAYSDMIVLEQNPTRVELLEKYIRTLSDNAWNYKWVMRQLSVTFKHIVGINAYRDSLSSILEGAIEAAISRRDDAALVDLFAYSFHVGKAFDRIMGRLGGYVKLRRREGEQSGAAVLLGIMIDLFHTYKIKDASALNEVMNGVLPVLAEDRAWPMFKMAIRHPVFAAKYSKLTDKVDRLDELNDPYGIYMKLITGSIEHLCTDGELDTDKFIDAILWLHELRIAQETTFESAGAAVASAVRVLRGLPPAIVGRATARIVSQVDEQRVSVHGLSSLQVAMYVNLQCENKDAVDQSRQLLSLMGRIRPEGHGDLIYAMITHGDVCAHFGADQEALESYLKAYRCMGEKAPDSAVLIGLAYKILCLPAMSCHSVEELRAVLNLALVNIDSRKSYFYAVYLGYTYRLSEKYYRGELGAEELLSELWPVAYRSKAELKEMDAMTQNSALKVIDFLGRVFVNRREFSFKERIDELYEQYILYGRRASGKLARINKMDLEAYSVMHREGVACIPLYEAVVSECLKSHVLLNSASNAVRMLLNQHYASGARGFPEGWIRSRKGLGILADLKQYFLYLCLSIEEYWEHIYEHDEIFDSLIPYYLCVLSEELYSSRFGIGGREFMKFKNDEQFYLTVLQVIFANIDRYEDDIKAKGAELLRKIKGESAPEEQTSDITRTVNELLLKVSRLSERIGRNDLCPCGSGKKYKSCCGAQDGGEERE